MVLTLGKSVKVAVNIRFRWVSKGTKGATMPLRDTTNFAPDMGVSRVVHSIAIQA